MKRIMTVLAVAALMAVMMVAMAAPAFAAKASYTCTQEGWVTAQVTKKSVPEYESYGFTCVKN